MADRVRRNGQTVGVQKTFHVETLWRFLSDYIKGSRRRGMIFPWQNMIYNRLGFNGCKKVFFSFFHTLIIRTNNIVRHYIVNGGILVFSFFNTKSQNDLMCRLTIKKLHCNYRMPVKIIKYACFRCGKKYVLMILYVAY